ncbi:hypothetical protein G127AT_13385 [Agromyces archimandritae]|uniref:Mannosyltransferase PIG-V n=2 Tax=Agromyces archimandritae TaxID=2781962 RepID=A0A975FQL9_9MICO|nr:hypothetical protein G127AT_13385 [Agromyces archimandritae]
MRVLAVFVGGRAVSTVLVLALANVQGANPWTAARPDYWSFANLWDARWFQLIAYWGYPSELPLDDAGHVAENAWAFMPVYPFLVRIATLTGLPWNVASVLVSVAAGLGAALVLYRLMTRFLDAGQALFTVVLFSVAPVSAIMQFGYAEALSYLCIGLALLFLVDRRYALIFPVVAVWSVTRPGALAFALALGFHFLLRLRRRRVDPFPARERWLLVALGLFTAVAGLAWAGIAWAVTGSMTAYTDTELAWRAAYIGPGELAPFTPWFTSADWWLGQPLGTVAVIALVIAFALLLVTPWVRRLGPDLRFWFVSYGLYLLAVFFPQSSVFRMLSPMFPMLGALAVPRSRAFRVAAVVVSIALQLGWLMLCWAVDGRDWTPP